jgi:CO/xanthine dehydrogenase Mo-binding subunit
MDGDITIDTIDRLALTWFGVGQPVPRNEDPTLLRGEGRYTDDLNLPGQAYAVIVRSRHAHGVIMRSTPAKQQKCRACSASIPARI